MKKKFFAWGIALLAIIGVAVAITITLDAGYPIDFEVYANDADFDADPFFEQTKVGPKGGSIDLKTNCGVGNSQCVEFDASAKSAGPRLKHTEQGLVLLAGHTYFVSYGGTGTARTRGILESEGNEGSTKVKSLTNEYQSVIATFTPINDLTTSTWKIDAKKGILDIDDTCQGELTDLNGTEIFTEDFESFADDIAFDADPSFVQTTLGEDELNPFAGTIDLVINGSKEVQIITNPDFKNRLEIVKTFQ